MTDDDLRFHLRKLATPAVTETARERARHRALLALSQPDTGKSTPAGNDGFVRRWAPAFVAVLLACVAWSVWSTHREPRENLAEDQEMVRQVEKLFPGQIDSIVERNGKIDLNIAQSPLLGSDQPVVIVFRRGSEAIRVLSYSGHHLCVSLGAQRDCLEILATPNGGVILESDTKAWLASPDTELAGYHVTARSLPTL